MGLRGILSKINFSKYNPYSSFRTGQETAISEMLDLFGSGQKIIELNAPTAAGKTACLYVFGRYLEKEQNIKKVTFTSPQVALIENGNLFDLPKLVGKRNYKCSAIKDYTAEDCPFTSKEDGFAACDRCKYRLAKQYYKDSDFGAVTFARYLADPSIYTATKVLVVDESSELEGQLLDKATISLDLDINKITTKRNIKDQLPDVQRYLTSFDIKDYLMRKKNSLQDVSKQVSKSCQDYRRAIFDSGKRRPTNQEMQKLKFIQMDYNKNFRNLTACNNALRYINSDSPYIITTDIQEVWNDKTRRKEKAIVPYFKLLNAYLPFGDLVANLDCIILASGTPTTNLVTSKHKSVIVSHPIPVDRRLIYYDPVGSMNYQNRDKLAPLMARKIQQLHDTYSKHTIVHCGSYYIANLIYQNLSGEHVICQEPDWREGSLQKWQSKQEGIFLSVRFEEGISLDGPEYPMNIVAKVPFPNLSDKWVESRNKLDNWTWYAITTACLVQQACGRTTRSPDDYSETHILDGSFGSFLSRNRQLFMPWFLEALK